MSIYYDIQDSDISDIYIEAVNFRPARKTVQRAGDRDGRLIAAHREAECINFSWESESFSSDSLSDLLESYGLPSDLMPDDEQIQDSLYSGEPLK